MKKLIISLAAGAAGLLSLGLTAAHADHGDDRRPDYCDVNHDHRSHASNYYTFYPQDRYSRAGDYRRDGRGSGVSLSVSVGDRYDDRRAYRGNDRGRRNGYRGRQGRTVYRQEYDTRYRARIILTEEVIRGRRGPRLVCTVAVRGPQARYVSERRVHRIARRDCSRNASVRIRA